jgi:uncharacterized protein YbjT (DUF2867 family)
LWEKGHVGSHAAIQLRDSGVPVRALVRNDVDEGHDHQVYTPSGPEVITFDDLAQELSRALEEPD